MKGWQINKAVAAVVAALALVLPIRWISAELQRSATPRAAESAIVGWGGEVDFDSSRPPWLRALLRDDSFAQAPVVRLNNSAIDDQGLRYLRVFERLEELQLGNTRVTDDGIAELARLRTVRRLSLADTRTTDAAIVGLRKLAELHSLNLSGTRVTDVGLGELTRFRHLRELALQNTKVGNAGLASIGQLQQLEVLDLRESRITDSGLAHLAGLDQLSELNLASDDITDQGLALVRNKNLKWLTLDDTQVTLRGVADLQRRLPRCKVYTSHMRLRRIE